MRPRLRLALVLLLVAALVLLGMRALHRRDLGDRLMRADPESVLADPTLAGFALEQGKAGFATHCAACHGTGKGDPTRGIPDLTDGDTLYGEGQVSEIEAIVLHGIRSGDPRGWDLADMPAYSHQKPYAREPIPPLTPSQIADVTQYLLRLHGRAKDAAAAERGQILFKTNGACWDCHGNDGGGDTAVGAPNLLDDVWLYGDGSAGQIAASIANGRGGKSPAFAKVLSPLQARAIAVYVASLSHKAETRHD